MWRTFPADEDVDPGGHELAVLGVELGEGLGVMLCKGIHELGVGRLNLIDESCMRGRESCSQLASHRLGACCMSYSCRVQWLAKATQTA